MASFTVVQTPAPTFTATVTSGTIAFGSNVTAGDLLIVWARLPSAPGSISVSSGTAVVSWTLIRGQYGANGDKYAWLGNVTTSGSCTVQCSGGATTGTVRIGAREYAPPAGTVPAYASDAVTANGASVASLSIGPIASVASGNLVIALCMGGNTGTVTAGVAAPNSDFRSANQALGNAGIEDNLNWAGGSATATFSFGATGGDDGIIFSISPSLGGKPTVLEARFGQGPIGRNPADNFTVLGALLQSNSSAPASTTDPTVMVPRIGVNGIVSARTWLEDAPNRDGWYDTTAMGSSTVGHLNVDADFAILDKLLGGLQTKDDRALRLRFEIPWRYIEQTQGSPDWSHLDYVATAMMKRGIIAHAIILWSPPWVGSSTTAPQPTQFASFVTALVSRYKRWGTFRGQNWGIRIWEMWNEPDHTHYGALTGTVYATNLLVPGYTAAKAVDPNCLVVCAGQSVTTATFCNAMSAAGAATACDVVGVHDYNGTPSQLNADYNSYYSIIRGATPTAFATQPVWFDEFGIANGSTGPTLNTYLTTVYPVGSQSPSAPSIAYYNLREDTNTLGESFLGATGGLTAGTAVTSLTITNSLPNMANTDPVVLVYMAGDGVVHFQQATCNGPYTGGTTVTINSLTPNYSFPASNTQVQAGVNGKTLQQYGLLARDGSVKDPCGGTFQSFLSDQGWMSGVLQPDPGGVPPSSPGPRPWAQFRVQLPPSQTAGTPHSQALTAALSFAGSITRTTGKALAAGLSFAGAIGRSIGHGMSAGLSFAGSMGRATARSLSGSLSFAGSNAKATGRALAGGLSFAGVAARATGRSLAAGLSFTGTISRATGRGLNASLSFAGAFSRATGRSLSAGLSFTGKLARSTARSLAGALSFSGLLSAAKNGGGTAYNQALTAALSFTGAISRGTSHGMTAALSFAGALSRATSRALSAGLSFAGAASRSTARGLAGALSFTGQVARSTGRGFTAALSFSGAIARSTARGLSAGLSFAGSASRATARGLAAGLSFAGAQTRAIARTLTATLSFSGVFSAVKNGGSHAYQQSLSAALSFTGAVSRATSRGMTAGLAFSGAVARTTARGFAAALSFAGAASRSTLVVLAGSLSYAGRIGRGIGRALGAVLSFVGALVGFKTGASTSPGHVDATFALEGQATASFAPSGSCSATLTS